MMAMDIPGNCLLNHSYLKVPFSLINYLNFVMLAHERQTLILKKKYSKYKNNIINDLNRKKIEVRPVWKLIHTLKPYKKMPKMNLANSTDLYKRIINIPSSANL